MKPIRGLLIKILFRALNVSESMKGLAIYEDLKVFEGHSEESIGLDNRMKYRHSMMLARLYLDEDYKNYLYYLMMKVQKDNVQTIEPYKRDAQTATFLWINKHIFDMSEAFKKVGKPKGPKEKKRLKEVMRKAKGRTKDIGKHLRHKKD